MERGHVINVLDKGYVKLIDFMGSDESIIEAARMSTGKGFEGWDKDQALLSFLWKHKHTTPFEMCEMAIEVQAPIFVFREWHRHRTQAYNEFSARYSQMPNLHYKPDISRIKKQSAINKQGSGEEIDPKLAEGFVRELVDEQSSIYETYENMLQQGIAKEVARINTPVSRYSKMRAKTDLLNWLRFLDLRMRPDAQYEIRVFAEAVGKLVKEWVPRTWSLFEETNLYGVHFSQTEMQVLRDTLFLLTIGRSNWKDEFVNRAKHFGWSGRRLDEFINKLENGGREMLV
jgi:thymidylate synthase (FAD)